MNLTCDSKDLDDYLCELAEVDYSNPIIRAKSNLLAALLRSQGIPTGFCYQRLMLFDTPDKGYCIHVLNAIFFHSLNKWIRLDSRGNKTGIDVQFSLEHESLAFPIQQEFDEVESTIPCDICKTTS